MIGRRGSFRWCFGTGSIRISIIKRSMSKRRICFTRKRNIRMNRPCFQACIQPDIIYIPLLCCKLCSDHEVLRIASH